MLFDLSLAPCIFSAKEMIISNCTLEAYTAYAPTATALGRWQEDGMVTLPIQEVFQVLHVPSVKVFKFRRKTI